jgi:high-affinity iron transporter
VHELQEAAVLPTVVEHVWDTNPVLDEGGVVGRFLTALLGYNGNPSLLEVVAYGLYLIVIGAASLWPRHSMKTAAQTGAS